MTEKTEHNTDTNVPPAGHACGLRRCEQCGYAVTDPMVGRCPRCWSALPAVNCGSCSGCGLHLSIPRS